MQANSSIRSRHGLTTFRSANFGIARRTRERARSSLGMAFIRERAGEVRTMLENRGDPFGLLERGTFEALLTKDVEFRRLTTQRDELRQERGLVSKPGPDQSIERAGEIKTEIQAIDPKVEKLGREIKGIESSIPNMLHPSVPIGKGEKANEILGAELVARPIEDALPHEIIGERLGILDLEAARRMSGARFAIYRGAGSQLERALQNYMLDQAARNGYERVSPPHLVNAQALFGTGALPKFADGLFQVEGRDLHLIATAENPLTNLYMGEILGPDVLPISVTAYTRCFRSEVDSGGRDTHGLIRLHEFGKVELLRIVRPSEAEELYAKTVADAESVLQTLDLPYRKVLLGSGDTGFSAARTIDLEVWMPGQNEGQGAFREISSISMFNAFQGRRTNTRFRMEGERKPQFVHTINGSGLAVDRTFAAILENFQHADGSVSIPEKLQPYMDGLERIRKA